MSGNEIQSNSDSTSQASDGFRQCGSDLADLMGDFTQASDSVSAWQGIVGDAVRGKFKEAMEQTTSIVKQFTDLGGSLDQSSNAFETADQNSSEQFK